MIDHYAQRDLTSETALNFAIVGCGRIAQRHAEHIAGIGRLSATCDIVAERSDSLAKSYGAVPYQTIGAMLSGDSDIDVVTICTPNGLHATHTIAALRSGRHVICEKPMALTASDCSEMIRAAKQADRRLFIVKQNRFNPPVAAVKQAVTDGRLGRISTVQLNCFWNRNSAYYQDSWKGTRTLDGGCLYTQFSHFIDLLYWLVGDVRDVFAFTENFDHRSTVEFEDCGVVALRFESGALGTIHFTINSHERNMEGSLTLFGDKGTVKVGGQYLNELDYQNIEGFAITDLPPGNPPNQYGHYQGSMSNHDKVYKNVVDVLQRGDKIATGGFEGMKTVEIIEKIYQAAERVACGAAS